MAKQTFRPVGNFPPRYPRPTELQPKSLRDLSLVAVGSLLLGTAAFVPVSDAQAGKTKSGKAAKKVPVPGGKRPPRQEELDGDPGKKKAHPPGPDQGEKPVKQETKDTQAGPEKPSAGDKPGDSPGPRFPPPPGVPPLPREPDPVPIAPKKSDGTAKNNPPAPKANPAPPAKVEPTKK